MTSDHNRNPAPRPTKEGMRSRIDTSAPLAALGEKDFTSGRKVWISVATAGGTPAAVSSSLRRASRRASRTKLDTSLSVARAVQTWAAGLPSMRSRKTTASSRWASGVCLSSAVLMAASRAGPVASVMAAGAATRRILGALMEAMARPAPACLFSAARRSFSLCRSRSAWSASRTVAARPVAPGPCSITATVLIGSAERISSGMPPPSTANSGKASNDSQKPTVLA